MFEADVDNDVYTHTHIKKNFHPSELGGINAELSSEFRTPETPIREFEISNLLSRTDSPFSHPNVSTRLKDDRRPECRKRQAVAFTRSTNQ